MDLPHWSTASPTARDNAGPAPVSRGTRGGLVSEERYRRVLEKYSAVEKEAQRLEHTGARPISRPGRHAGRAGEPPAPNGARLADLLAAPGSDTGISPL